METQLKLKHFIIGFSSVIILLNIPVGIYFLLKGIVVSNDWMSTAGLFQVLLGTYMYLYFSEIRTK